MIITEDFSFILAVCALSKVKYLGVLFDQKMSWQNQFSNVIANCFRKIGILSRYSNSLTEYAQLLFYKSVIKPNLDYCCVAWSGCISTQYKRLDLFGKEAVRIITSVRKYDYTGKHFQISSLQDTVKEIKSSLLRQFAK